MDKVQNGLQVGTSYRHILQIALPICASIFVPQINYLTNTIFLAALGEKVLGVAGIAGVYYLIFSVVGVGLNSGVQALISRKAGENNPEAIARYFNQGMLVAFAVALFGIAFSLLVTPYIFEFAIQDPEKLELTNQFIRIRIWGLPFLFLYQMRNALLVGINQSRFLLIGTLVETVLNIVLDYGLIYGQLGLPKLGMNGAAYASIAAEAAGFFVVMVLIRTPAVRKIVSVNLSWKPYRAEIVQIFKISSPIVFQYLLSIMAWEYFYLVIEHYGTRELAISALMRNIFGLFGCFTWAFASTTTTMVSNVIGQGLQQQVFPLIKRILLLSVSVTVAMSLLLNSFPSVFFAAFSQPESFVAEALPVMYVVSIALVFMAVGITWVSAVTGTGHTYVNFLGEGLATLLYCLYVYFAMVAHRVPVHIGWMSEWIYWTTLFAVHFAFMKTGKWRVQRI